MEASRKANLNFTERWQIYFSERFPPLQHGILIAAFVIGAQAYSAQLHGHHHIPGLAALLSAILVTFLLFLQLRILDEFKDFEDDARWRPYRPVQRGVVTLHALAWLWILAAAVQVVVSYLFDTRLLLLLVVIWAYSGLMGVEFFVRDWLKAHPVAYMASHMIIVPMIALYITAFDWLQEGWPDGRIGWLLAVSYFGFSIIEIGRKIRAREDEEEGVETYSALWGIRNAVMVWLVLMALAGGLAVIASLQIAAPIFTLTFVVLMFLASLAIGLGFLNQPRPGQGKQFQLLSGLWTVGIYLVLGLAAWLLGSGAPA